MASSSSSSSSAASLAKRSFPFIALFSLAYLLLTNKRRMILPSSTPSSFSSEPSSSPPTISDPDSQVEFDFAPFLRLYKSGRVERRAGTAVVPASPSAAPGGGAASFDVVLDPLTGLAARLYLPVAGAGDGDPEPKLPILVYFHGGAFVVESAFSPTYHRYLDRLVARARIVAVSVEYRLAPEHPLPAAYADAWAALRWAAANARPGKFLARYGDPGRIFLGGVSAGANIAHNAALRAGSEEEEGVRVRVRVAGLVLQNPYFWGKEPVAGETRDAGERGRLESTWGFVCAGAYGIDHPYVNPMGTGKWGRGMGCGRAMVTVAEDDVFRARGVAYAEGLRRSGFAGEVELYEARGEWHAYFLAKLDSAEATKEIDAVAAFINRP